MDCTDCTKTYLTIDKDLTADPLLLPGMDQVVTRILSAVASNELIGIYGDFDTDGVTATALLVQAFEELGEHEMRHFFELNIVSP